MTTQLLALLILSSCLHAAWNLAGRKWRGVSDFLWGVGVWTGIWAITAFPFAVHSLQWQPTLILCAVASGTALGGYMFFVERAYRTGDISLVYPLIRSSPLWVSLLSVLFFGETLSPAAWGGVLCATLGVCVLPLRSLHPKAAVSLAPSVGRTGILFALAASFCTCVYSLSDKVAMELAATGVLAGAGLVGVSWPLGLFVWAGLHRNGRRGFHWRTLTVPPVSLWQMALYGLCSYLAYTIVIGVMIHAGAGRVLAVTNLGVVLGALGGILFFGERERALPRLLGLGLVVTGIILLRLF